MTTLSLNYLYAIEDRTRLYLAKLVKDLVKDYKKNRNWMYRSQYFLKIILIKGLYYRYKGKRYVIEVVITTKKLLLDGFKNIKDDLGKALNQ